MKRAFDLATSSILLIALAIPMVGIGIVLLLTQGPPLIFRQQRMGRSGMPFQVLKFRTMRAPKPGDVAITAGDEDPRITASAGCCAATGWMNGRNCSTYSAAI